MSSTTRTPAGTPGTGPDVADLVSRTAVLVRSAASPDTSIAKTSGGEAIGRVADRAARAARLRVAS